jgi:hypothetical protein
MQEKPAIVFLQETKSSTDAMKEFATKSGQAAAQSQ